MITFIPSKRLLTHTNIDYALLSLIFTCFLRTSISGSFKLERARLDWSGFWPDDNIIRIDTKQGTSLQYIVSTILHEIRHAIQLKNNIAIKYEYNSYDEYYNSIEECDARSFENLTQPVCDIYNMFEALSKKKQICDVAFNVEAKK